jgi:hypothetical protein
MDKRYYIILGVLAGLFILINVNTPDVVNWKPTFRKKDKNPYGAEVTYAFLEDIFGKGNVSTSNASPYDYLHLNKDQFNMIYVAQAIQTNELDMESILEFADNGNNIFIAAEYVIGPLADTLGISEIFYHPKPYTYQDSITLSFTNQSLERKEYAFAHDNVMNYLLPNTNNKREFIILSESSDYQAHYVRIPWGKGNIFYHTNPLLFTNFNMLFASNQHKYISNCFSYLPKQKTIWSEFYSKGSSQEEESTTELRYILKNPRLKWAWFILLGTIAVYMLFQSRRRQRAIPIVKPPGNSTLEFVETTGRLYFQQRNHGNLAMKKITFFLEKVRNKYYISTSVLNDQFIEALASKSGVPQDEIRILVKYFEAVKTAHSITETQLLDLNKKIESFYTKASL